jgi:3-hydroxyisobutyrate dehydrogenase
VADVALLGAGRMGAAMVQRLAAAGHEVAVWNRTADRADALARQDASGRTRAAGSPEQAVSGVDVVLSVLADGETTCRVLLDPGLLPALRPGAVVVDLGTSGVDAARRLDEALRSAGAAFVDAPVSGSVPAVTAGTLLVMASGRPEDVDVARPVLEAFASVVLHVGPAGAGQAMKLAVNLVVHDLNAALSESLALAERAGIAPELAYDVLQRSVVGAPFVQYKRAAFLDASTPVAMSLDLVAKDLRLVVALAEQVGADVSSTRGVAQQVDAARQAGHGAQDMASLARFLRGSTSA